MNAAVATPRIALVGNPNCGKTALFNQLTGSRQKVANYAGVTVERKEGRLHSAASGRHYAVLDLPGAYSLHAASLDEAVTRDVCRGFYPGEAAPDVLVCVVDATNLRLHLRAGHPQAGNRAIAVELQGFAHAGSGKPGAGECA